jgi:hypothetical protein
MENRAHYRSLFWPVVLIGVGVLWLLTNLGYLTTVRMVEIWRLWPALLILAGIDILFARRVPLIGALIGLLVVILIGYGLLVGVPVPSGSSAGVTTDNLAAPVEQAQSASVTLDFWSDPVSVYSLSDSPNVIDAHITHTGAIHFNSSGSTTKSVSLSHDDRFSGFLFWGMTPETRADVGLTPMIPLDLRVHTASGSSTMDFSGLNLSNLTIDSGSGSVELTLPKSGVSSTAQVHTASGSANIVIPADAPINLETQSGSGSLNIQLPAGAALHIEALDDGSGSLSLPRGLVQVRQGNGDTGSWETPGFQSAKNKISITLQGVGSGSISIH